MSDVNLLKKDFIKASLVFNAISVMLIILHILFSEIMNDFIRPSTVIFCLTVIFDFIIVMFYFDLRKKNIKIW